MITLDPLLIDLTDRYHRQLFQAESTEIEQDILQLMDECVELCRTHQLSMADFHLDHQSLVAETLWHQKHIQRSERQWSEAFLLRIITAWVDHGAPLTQPLETLVEEDFFEQLLRSKYPSITAYALERLPDDYIAQSQALRVATDQGNHAVMAELIRRGAPVDGFTTAENWTPLFYAARANDRVAMDLLLAHGANPKHLNRDGFGLAHIAARNDYVDQIPFLVSIGVPFDTRDSSGDTPLSVAQSESFNEFAMLLTEILKAQEEQAELKAIFGSASHQDSSPTVNTPPSSLSKTRL